ncbi:MAG: hypothetical protein ABW042_05195 [Phenylobacterium sp.]
MRPFRLMFGIALSATLAAPALAAPAPGHFYHPADVNRDERITRTEWVASGEEAASFRVADSNRDGAMTGPEFARWFMAKEGIAPVRTSERQPSGAMDRLVQRR